MTEKLPWKRVIAAFDDDAVIVYQAFRPEIVHEAVKKGTFGKGFSLDRMTWIKPSFGWMLHRSGYATKHRQEAIARVKLSHEGFLSILEQGVATSYKPQLFETRDDWARALDKSDVRYQWDPERDLYDHKLPRRAIQLGLRGGIVRRYVNDWIIGIEDVTELAHAIKAAIDGGDRGLPEVPHEREYPVPPEIARTLAYDEISSGTDEESDTDGESG